MCICNVSFDHFTSPLSNSYLSVSLLYHTSVNESRRSLVYHPQLVAVYHQPVGLDIIKPQGNARLRVMRYKGGEPPLMIYAALRAVMICQACGLDKQKRNFCLPKVPFLFIHCESNGISSAAGCILFRNDDIQHFVLMIYRNKLRIPYKAYALIYLRKCDIIDSPIIQNLTGEYYEQFNLSENDI